MARTEYIMKPRGAKTPQDNTQVNFAVALDLSNEAKGLNEFDKMIGLPVPGIKPHGKPVFYKKIGQYTVWLVDDFAIRNTSVKHEEFSNWAIHVDFPDVVPKGQIWISKSEKETERKFYIDNALTRLKALADGASKGGSYDRSLRAEEKLRKQDDKITKRPGYLSEHAPKEPEPTKVPKDIYVRKLGVYKGYNVWIVNSEKVQDTYKTDWVDGGNDSVYHFIPANELWLSDALDKEELKFVVWHEWVESWLMRHKGWTYDRAHRRASATEYELRKDLGYGRA